MFCIIKRTRKNVEDFIQEITLKIREKLQNCHFIYIIIMTMLFCCCIYLKIFGLGGVKLNSAANLNHKQSR